MLSPVCQQLPREVRKPRANTPNENIAKPDPTSWNAEATAELDAGTRTGKCTGKRRIATGMAPHSRKTIEQGLCRKRCAP
eukprot:2977956-Alexandrium_andersonii.AAC.1